MPARDTTTNGAGECLRLPCACGLCCDSIQAAACLLTNEVGLAPVSNRVVTESEVGLLPVVMQHVRYMVSISVSSQLHVMSSVVTAMLVDMVGEAGGLELAVLGVLLGGVARLGCSCGLVP